MRNLFVALSLLVCVSVNAAPHYPKTFPNRAGGPALTFSENTIALSGATPGATLYVASVSLGSVDYEIKVENEAGVVTADASGAAQYPTKRPLQTRGVWVVVDGATGGYTVAAPPGRLLREMDFPGNGFGNTGGGALRRFALTSRHSVEAILVRPSSGMWTGSFNDGGRLDGDKTTDGSIDADVATLAPVGNAAAAPDRVMPGDLLVLIDRITLEYHVSVHGR